MSHWKDQRRSPIDDPTENTTELRSRLRFVATELEERATRDRETSADSPGRRLDLNVPSAHELLAAVEHMSWRIDDLARELNCLGHFDDDDPNRPRAA